MASPGAIAIVGMAGRFPGAPSVDELWTLLREGRESIRTLQPDELENDHSFAAQPNFVPAQGALDDIELFDADFFGYTAAEAENADPQQRVLLECAWEALEHAGYDPRGLKSIPVGFCAGSGVTFYGMRRLMATNGPCLATMQSLIGCDKDYLATRISYKLGLRGPSQTIASACSTSLVAVAIACEQLLDHSVDMALAGGANILVPHLIGYLHEDDGFFSSDGHCRPFDARGDGTVPSAGAGIVVLKRLEDAVADRDFIWASIRGFAVNNDGDDKVGFMAPSAAGQARVIGNALAAAGLKPDDITYIEAHGTATAIGDPIEIQALTRAYAARTRREQYCAISAIKSNFGDLNTASGVAGLIKVALALHHRQIPATLHFERPNPRIDFSTTPFFVNTVLRPWNETRRYAGLNSFGHGGTNVHMILEEAPARPTTPTGSAPYLLPLSARSEAALARAAVALREYLAAHPDVDLAAVASTLQSGRHLFRHRRAVICESVKEAIARLDPDDRSSPPMRAADPPPSVVFLFPGPGRQQLAMGQHLYDGEPAFREVVDRCARRLTPLIGHDVHELILSPDVGQTPLDETGLSHPALFVFQIAMATLLRKMGLEPAAVVGQSVGDLAAAYVAGAVDLDDALEFVAERTRVKETMPGGGAAAVAERRIPARAAKIPLLSLTTGDWHTPGSPIPSNGWASPIGMPTPLEPGFQRLFTRFPSCLGIETGPGHSLSELGNSHPSRSAAARFVSAYGNDANGGNRVALRHAVGFAFTAGARVNFAQVRGTAAVNRVPLPTYPFERQPYWAEEPFAVRPQPVQKATGVNSFIEVLDE